jgi:hypothetical protein
MPHFFKRAVVTVVCLLANSALRADDNLSCINEIELPRFATSVRVPTGGHVLAAIRLGPDGQVDSVSLSSSEPDLLAEVEYHLRKKTVYRPDCRGKEVRLEFTFRVEGAPSVNPYSIVRFRPPNHFVIVTQPVISTPDHMPPPNARQGADPGKNKR